VKALAEAAQKSTEEEKQDLADTAITMLKGLISGLPGAAALVEACNKLLPAIAPLISAKLRSHLSPELSQESDRYHFKMSSIAIRYLNGDPVIVERVIALPAVVLPLPVVGELLFGAENSARPLQNLTRYLNFIEFCVVVPMGRETARAYSQTRLGLRRKGRPIPENDIWIAAQCLENNWILATNDEHFTYVDGLTVERW
jgi:tRNA(fMet)-specific endonuclease VapC